MILIDFSQIVISSAVDYHLKTREQIDINLLRHIALNTLLNVKERLGKYADEVVICIDGRNYWRRTFFPPYKQNRKKQQKKDSFDWNLFHEAFNQLKQEFKDNLPYKVIEVETAEADDIIAVLSMVFGPSRDVVIVSSDKDLIQISLNICPRVKQYSPFHKKFISDLSGYSFFEHVIRGDQGDGIPNIFSDDDTFLVEGKRQTPIRADCLKEWAKTGLANPEVFCKNLDDLRRFERNRKLIDLTMIPEELKQRIMTAYNEVTVNRGALFNYLVQHKLKKILERGNF